MPSMNISLPGPMKNFVEEQVGDGYRSVSEYVRELVRADQKRKAKETSGNGPSGGAEIGTGDGDSRVVGPAAEGKPQRGETEPGIACPN